MPRLTNYCGSWVRHGGWYPDRKVRLWSKGSGSWSTPRDGDMLHERWIPNESVKVHSFRSDLLHYSYHSTSDHLRQWAKFARLGAADAVRSGRGSSKLKPLVRAVFQWTKQCCAQGAGATAKPDSKLPECMRCVLEMEHGRAKMHRFDNANASEWFGPMRWGTMCCLCQWPVH